MSWIEPLNLEKWMLNVFSGSVEVFTAIALTFIFGMAGYFRMPMLISLLMLSIFIIMFSGSIMVELYFIVLALGSLAIGFAVSQIIKK